MDTYRIVRDSTVREIFEVQAGSYKKAQAEIQGGEIHPVSTDVKEETYVSYTKIDAKA